MWGAIFQYFALSFLAPSVLSESELRAVGSTAAELTEALIYARYSLYGTRRRRYIERGDLTSNKNHNFFPLWVCSV